jgi:hypothetical protein
MGITASLFVARDDIAYQIVSNPKIFDPDCADYMRITSAELSTLWAVLQGVDSDTDMTGEFEVVFDEDDGECVIQRLPAGMVAALAELSPDQITAVAQKWGDADDIEPRDVAREIVRDLVRLANSAIDTLQNVYLFNLV